MQFWGRKFTRSSNVTCSVRMYLVLALLKYGTQCHFSALLRLCLVLCTVLQVGRMPDLKIPPPSSVQTPDTGWYVPLQWHSVFPLLFTATMTPTRTAKKSGAANNNWCQTSFWHVCDTIPVAFPPYVHYKFSSSVFCSLSLRVTSIIILFQQLGSYIPLLVLWSPTSQPRTGINTFKRVLQA